MRHFWADMLTLFVYSILFVPICGLSYTLLFLTSLVTLTSPLVIRLLSLIYPGNNAPDNYNNFSMKCGFIFPLVPISFAITAISVTLIMRSLISLLNIAFLLLTGLYLNGEFYSPIVFPLLLLAVYCWNGW